MVSISRRSVLAAAGAAAVADAMWRPASAASKTMARYNVTSAKGQAMLAIYADAVGKMMAGDQGRPMSWTFQWYMHAIPTKTTKAKELTRLYPAISTPGSAANKALASATWDTCEPHFSGAENNFLPWHRMFVAHFEDIIRAVSGKPEFTLPYWNYTAAGGRALPAQFQKKGDPQWGPLYRKDRNPASNANQPIDSFPQADPINLDAMTSAYYDDTGGDGGFCALIDNGPHGSIHDDVGDDVGMGSVPWAANDPIFWLHHCNIDRIWASWNKAGGKNPGDPAYLAESFTFVGKLGAAVQTKVADVLDTHQLHYVYDRYLARPAGSTPFPTAPALALDLPRLAVPLPSSGPVQLGGAQTTVELALPTTGPQGVVGGEAFSERLQLVPPGRKVRVRLVGVQADAEVGGAYDVYLNLPAGAAPSRASAAYLGTVSFFGLGVHRMTPAMADGMAAGMAMGHPGRTISFEVRARARAAALKAVKPLVTFVPTRAIKAGSSPRIASVEIVTE